MLLAFFSDIDGLDNLIDASMPLFAAWLLVLAGALAVFVIAQCVDRALHRSPIDKLLRRRFG